MAGECPLILMSVNLCLSVRYKSAPGGLQRSLLQVLPMNPSTPPRTPSASMFPHTGAQAHPPPLLPICDKPSVNKNDPDLLEVQKSQVDCGHGDVMLSPLPLFDDGGPQASPPPPSTCPLPSDHGPLARHVPREEASRNRRRPALISSQPFVLNSHHCPLTPLPASLPSRCSVSRSGRGHPLVNL